MRISALPRPSVVASLILLTCTDVNEGLHSSASRTQICLLDVTSEKRNTSRVRPHCVSRRLVNFSAAWWSGALRHARPRSGPRGCFCLRQQRLHSPHLRNARALGHADAPATGRLQRSGSRQARGGSYHSPGGEG